MQSKIVFNVLLICLAFLFIYSCSSWSQKESPIGAVVS
jgi:hypothetical protein